MFLGSIHFDDGKASKLTQEFLKKIMKLSSISSLQAIVVIKALFFGKPMGFHRSLKPRPDFLWRGSFGGRPDFIHFPT